jgi:7-cyano-7-deazaguanine reductase
MTDPKAKPVLGAVSEYPQVYSPETLFPVPRAENRRLLGGQPALPFAGVDIWNAYELSWLDLRGKPVAATGAFTFPASSPNLIESKSLKLYLNSLNQTRFQNTADVHRTIAADLEAAAGEPVQVHIEPLAGSSDQTLSDLPGECLDELAIDVADYDVNPHLLRAAASGQPTAESLYTRLFKSNCPVTGQPDWASVLIRYRGPAIDRAGLLKYLVSYRNCSAFHEHCVESIFVHILSRCRPVELTVYARYLRRGGLDINPFRSNFEAPPENLRIPRQ